VVRRILLSILLVGLLGGVVRERQSTGTKDEVVKEESLNSCRRSAEHVRACGLAQEA
jgi:hypothetical protein